MEGVDESGEEVECYDEVSSSGDIDITEVSAVAVICGLNHLL